MCLLKYLPLLAASAQVEVKFLPAEGKIIEYRSVSIKELLSIKRNLKRATTEKSMHCLETLFHWC